MVLRLALRLVRRRTGDDLLPVRLLSWYPRAAVGAGVLELLATRRERDLTTRLLQLVRMTVSFTTSCPFCVGLNSQGWELVMTERELAAVQGLVPLSEIGTLSARESLAVEYARLASATPLDFPPGFGERLRALFVEREIVALAATAAQVNYWARLIQGLGCPAPG